MSPTGPSAPLTRMTWPPTASLPVDHPEVDPLPLRQRAHLGAPLEQHLGRLERLPGQDGVRAGLDDAGLLPGDLGHRPAQQVGVVEVDRRHDGDPGVGDVGRVPGPAQTDLDHGHVDRGIGEGREGHRGDDLEEGQLDAVDQSVVDQRDVRLDLPPRGVEALLADRGAVDGDPLGHARHVRRREPARAQTVGAEQGLDHGRRAALAVGPGQMDHRVGVLRVAEQLGQRPDPAETGRHPVLRPACGQRRDDLGVGGLGKHDPAQSRAGGRLSDRQVDMGVWVG